MSRTCFSAVNKGLSGVFFVQSCIDILTEEKPDSQVRIQGRGIGGERGMERVGGRRGTNREGKKEGVAGVTLKILKDYQKKGGKVTTYPQSPSLCRGLRMTGNESVRDPRPKPKLHPEDGNRDSSVRDLKVIGHNINKYKHTDGMCYCGL